MVALLISVPLYPFFIRSMEAAALRKATQRSEGAEGAGHVPIGTGSVVSATP